MADIFCDIDVPDYVQKECGVERAGIIAMLLIDKDDVSANDNQNLESLTYINNKLNTSPATWFLIQQTRGEYPGGTPTEEEGFGTESTQVTGADHTASVEVEGLIDNRDFWESVNRKKWKVALLTNAGFIFYIQAPVTIYAKINNPKSIKANAFWMVSLKWEDYSNPVVHETPDGLLDE
jgi:hypothetical protein